MKLRQLVKATMLLSVLSMAAGCSTLQGDAGGTTNVEQSSDIVADGPAASTDPEEAVKALDRDTRTESTLKATLDPKYKVLAQAVRAGRAQSMVEETAKILAANPHDAVALNTLALYHFRRGKVGAAKLLLGRALEKNAHVAAIQNNMGVMLLEEGESGAAMAHFKKAISLDGRHVEASGNLGSIYAKGGDYSKALPLLEWAYKWNKNNVAVATNYAIALRGTRNYEGAKQVYDDLIRQNVRDVGVLVNYAILLIDYMSKPKEGLEFVYKAKFIDTDRKDVLNRLNALEKKAKTELKL